MRQHSAVRALIAAARGFACALRRSISLAAPADCEAEIAVRLTDIRWALSPTAQRCGL